MSTFYYDTSTSAGVRFARMYSQMYQHLYPLLSPQGNIVLYDEVYGWSIGEVEDDVIINLFPEYYFTFENLYLSQEAVNELLDEYGEWKIVKDDIVVHKDTSDARLYNPVCIQHDFGMAALIDAVQLAKGIALLRKHPTSDTEDELYGQFLQMPPTPLKNTKDE